MSVFGVLSGWNDIGNQSVRLRILNLWLSRLALLGLSLELVLEVRFVLDKIVVLDAGFVIPSRQGSCNLAPLLWELEINPLEYLSLFLSEVVDGLSKLKNGE